MEGKGQQAATSYSFKLVLGGHETAGVFREATADVEGETVDLAEVQKISGLNKAGDITLKRGVDNNKVLLKWREVIDHKGADAARKDGQIQLFDYKGAPVATYSIINAWPKKYTGVGLRASEGEAALEEIVIAHEGLEKT
jgi:phage tail-like protein